MTLPDSASADAERIRAREAERCAAIVAGDRAALAALVSDDVIHVHGTGYVDDKAGYLAGIGGRYTFHDVARGPLDIRVHGDMALVVGTLHQSYSDVGSGERRQVDGITSQTWLRGADGEWRQNGCHNSFTSSRVVIDAPPDATG